jgi:hypothetical protein
MRGHIARGGDQPHGEGDPRRATAEVGEVLAVSGDESVASLAVIAWFVSQFLAVAIDVEWVADAQELDVGLDGF